MMMLQQLQDIRSAAAEIDGPHPSDGAAAVRHIAWLGQGVVDII
jgi:hypothetical protein